MTAALLPMSMRLLRVIFALLLASALPLAANDCLLAATFPGEIEDCCGDHHEPVPNGAAEDNCANCTTMETGVNPTATASLAAGAIEWREDALLSAALRRLHALLEMGTLSAVPESPPEERPLWHFVARTALPVRGPSLS